MSLRLVLVMLISLVPTAFFVELNETTTLITTTADQTKLEGREIFLENLRDIAYYLRAYKFNEYDRRYERNAETAPRVYFKGFPRPALRSLHWEVRKFCELSLQDCVDYLGKKLKYTALKRSDDTSVVIHEQKWTPEANMQQIKQVDEECQKMKRKDDIVADPFEGPLERFQWRVTASYYMCWYTMQGVPEMGHLRENCDNFAACLHPHFGPNNRDPRANDSVPFSCALYSFCPDPCCPFNHLTRLENCFDMPDNPCYRNNIPDQRKCFLNRTQNTDFSDIVMNRWNVSCKCPRRGFEWNSFFGMCIDTDECASLSPQTHNCDPNLEACVNLQGGFRCGCQWGLIWNEKTYSLCISRRFYLLCTDFISPEAVRNIYRAVTELHKSYPPTIHSVPTSFFPNSQEFSKPLSKTGMYRNYSLNTGLDSTPY